MEVATLNVEDRTASGTKQVRSLRNTGKIPIVLYGGGKDSVSLQADYTDVKRHLTHHLRVFKLHMGSVEQPGYLQNVQWDCLTDEPLHLDFLRIDMDQKLEIEVELVLLGHPKGLTAGGNLIRDVQGLPLLCLPSKIPEQIEIKVGHLDLGDKIIAGEVELPEGCTLNVPSDHLVLHISTPKAGAEDGLEEAEEGAEDAPAEGGDETPAEGDEPKSE